MFETSTRRWTVRELMRVAIEHLQQRGVDESRLSVELLLAEALKCPRIRLYTNFDVPVTAAELGTFRTLMQRRLHGEPVQYIVGSTHFMGLEFRVDPRTLIPRPETETLVEAVIMWANDRQEERPPSLIDIGTGCGNIAVSSAKLVRRLQAVAVDISEPALDVARSNVQLHGVGDHVACRVWDIYSDPPADVLGRFDAVVSNPPYIALVEWEGLQREVRDHEPQRALTDGGDGYRALRRIIDIGPSLLRNGGPVMLEVGDGQAEEIIRVMRRAGYENVIAKPDLQGTYRVVSGTIVRRNG